MAPIAYLDTHVVVWLYAGELERFPNAAIELLDERQLIVSPMVYLELSYLQEIGRLNVGAREIVNDLSSRVALVICDERFETVVRQAENERWTRDPFDRLIAAHARVKDAPLVTKDATIRTHYPRAIWDGSAPSG